MKQHYTNNTDKPVFIAGKLIHPGVTRIVDVAQPAKKNVFLPGEIMDSKVSELPTLLVELNLDQLAKCMSYEMTNQNRKSAIKAIDEAVENYEINADLAEFSANLSSIENLEELALQVAGNEAKLDLVEYEKEQRAAAAEKGEQD